MKAINSNLRDNHVRQAVEYGAREGINYVILTNGINWNIYSIEHEPLTHQDLCKFNFLDLNLRKSEDQEKLFLLCKEGLLRSAIEDYYERVQTFNRYVLGELLKSDEVTTVIRRQLRKLTPGIKVETNEIEKILVSGVIKREILEGDEADGARAFVKKKLSKAAREKKKADKSKSN